jgi:phytoene synthase
VELYTKTSYELSRLLTLRYSTSFSQSSGLFSADIRKHIFAIYGLVRIADEIVDTYDGNDKASLLKNLENDVAMAIQSGYSTNPIVQAYAHTAIAFALPDQLLRAFFVSMRMDLTKRTYSQEQYETYIYGSAEVIGLLCLKVFTYKTPTQYEALAAAAQSLGSAYQKVNFLRDIASDHTERGRMYFPGLTFETFNDTAKNKIIQDIKKDFAHAKPALQQLPKNAQKAVGLSAAYYTELLNRLEAASAHTIKTSRVRVPAAVKLRLFIKSTVKMRGR